MGNLYPTGYDLSHTEESKDQFFTELKEEQRCDKLLAGSVNAPGRGRPPERQAWVLKMSGGAGQAKPEGGRGAHMSGSLQSCRQLGQSWLLLWTNI